MPNKQCQQCYKEFYTKHSTGKFCSKSCANKKSALGKDRKQYTKEQLINHLRNLAKSLGHTPSKRELNGKKPSDVTYRNYFGTWNNAIIEAGLESNFKYPNSYNRNVRPKLRYKILSRDKFKCTYCGGKPEDGFALVIDHIIPVAKGGKTEKENLTSACWLCNAGKSDS